MPPVHPTADDPAIAALSEGVGGPVGSRAGRHPWWTPTRVVLVLAALCCCAGMIQKAPCFNDGWREGNQRYADMCYSDLPFLYTGRGFAELAWPYDGDEQVRARHPVMEYPVGISYWAWGAAWATHVVRSPDLDLRFARPSDEMWGLPEMRGETQVFVVVNALGFAVLTLLSVYFLSLVNPRRGWDAAYVAASPALALALLINWDLVAVLFVAGALWAWARDRPMLTGVMIGLGTAVKLYPLLLFGALVVVCLRDRRLFALARAMAAGLLAWLAANAPAYLSGPDQWHVFWRFNSDRGADLGSVWLVVAQAADVTLSPGFMNQWSLIFMVVWCTGVLVVGLLAPRTPRFAQLAFLIVVGFLLVNKVYSPQYVLWLLPLAALARPRLRDQAIWQGAEVFYFMAVWWYLGEYIAPPSGGDSSAYWLAIGIRVAGELYLVAIVTRDILRPEHDPVDRGGSGDDDPIERGRGEPDPDLELVADLRDSRAVGNE
ncbi:MAG: glycosyltransferase family 87 protein [Nocardioides sp.]